MPLALEETYQRYLRILEIEETPSGLEGLRKIVFRHICRVPFENISKLRLLLSEGAGRFLTLTEFLDGIEYQDLGGTCHACNPYLGDLLRALGYEVDLLAADMGERLNVHTCLRVRIDSVAYHVDVGYGGPFREPIRLDRVPFEQIEGNTRYEFRHLSNGAYEMAVFVGPERVHGYIVHGPPQSREFFLPALFNSFQPAAPFLNCMRICRTFDDRSVVLLDRTLSTHQGGVTTRRELNTPDEWAAALAYDLAMPRSPWKSAIPVLEQNTGKPFFGTDFLKTHEAAQAG